MKKKYIIIATILIASTAILGFFAISNKNNNKNIFNSYNNDDDFKEINKKEGYTLKNEKTESNGYNKPQDTTKDISILKEGIDLADFNIKFDSVTLSQSNLYFSYTITGTEKFGSAIELIACEADENKPEDDSFQQIRMDMPEDKSVLKASNVFSFTRAPNNFKDFKFKLKYHDYVKELPDTYRIFLDESTTVNKIIEMDTRKFYFDEFLETDVFYSLKFYIEGFDGDSLEFIDNLKNRYSIDQQFGDEFRFSGIYSHDLASENFKYEVFPLKCEITPVGQLNKKEIEKNKDFFGDVDKLYEFKFFISKGEMATGKYPDNIKLFLRSTSKNKAEFIGEFNG